MKKISKILGVSALVAAVFTAPTFAETSCTEGNTGLSISPVTKVLTIEGGTTYDNDVFTVKNVGTAEASFKVYASPYSAADENYNMNFSSETNFTQISRWISFKDTNGNYSNEVIYTVPACSEQQISYKIETPESIPGGGQYAVIFAEGINNSSEGGIKAISRVGLVVYGRATGETVNTAEISNVAISKSIDDTLLKKDGTRINGVVIHANSTVANTGNVDIIAKTNLTIKNIFGAELYNNTNQTSVLPESTRKIVDVWEDTPYLGLFLATYSINAANSAEEVTQLIFILPLPILVAALVLIAVIVIWIIALIKKKRARKARYMV